MVISCIYRHLGNPKYSVKGIVLLFGLSVLTPAAWATTQTQTEGVVSDFLNGWTNAGNAASIDGSCTYPTASSGDPPPLSVTDWKFTIPTGSIINGIEVTVRGASGAGTNLVRLRKVSGPVGSSKSANIPGAHCTLDYSEDTLGGSADLWGTTWTADEINATGFGVFYDADNASRQLDGFRITVDYTPPPPADLSIMKMDSADPVNANTAYSYVLKVSNAGTENATAVKVVDTLPVGVSYTSFSGMSWSCNETSGVVTCDLSGGIDASFSAPELTLNVVAPLQGGMITNTATVTANEFDPMLNNRVVPNDKYLTLGYFKVPQTGANAEKPVY